MPQLASRPFLCSSFFFLFGCWSLVYFFSLSTLPCLSPPSLAQIPPPPLPSSLPCSKRLHSFLCVCKRERDGDLFYVFEEKDDEATGNWAFEEKRVSCWKWLGLINKWEPVGDMWRAWRSKWKVEYDVSLSDCLLFPFSLSLSVCSGSCDRHRWRGRQHIHHHCGPEDFPFPRWGVPPVNSALFQPPSSPLCGHHSQSSSVNAFHSAMLSICSLTPSLSPSCLLTSWIGLLYCQETRTHWHLHNLKACCMRLSRFSLPLRALKLDWHISVNKICSTAS